MTSTRALLNRGKPVTLLDGRTVTVSFDLEALAQIEEDFGSLGGWQDSLNKIKEEQLNAQMMRPLLKMLRAGLLHDPSAADAQFDPQRLEEYFTAVMGAAEMAFPQTAQGNPTPSSPNDGDTGDSLGPTSTTSPQSVSDAQTVLSGA